MATKTNVKDVGWMYHTPTRKKERDTEHIVPYLSQIPLLSPAEIEDPNLANKQASYIKPTDSEYIALCKMGGRKNLLSMKEPQQKSDEATSYPRCEWFYLLDNQLADDENKPDTVVYKAQVPDYMVHDVRERRRKSVQQIHIEIADTPTDPSAVTKKKRLTSTNNGKHKTGCHKSINDRNDADSQKLSKDKVCR